MKQRSSILEMESLGLEMRQVSLREMALFINVALFI